jgi:hypothetical protein
LTARLAGTRAVLLTAAAVAVLLSGACGREDIELSHFTADASGEGAANEGGGFGEGGFSPCDRDGGGRPCHGIGEACSLAGECCSGRCETGSCMPKGACAVPGAACTTRADCCSGSCEPVPGTAARQCTDFCKREGEACARAQDCCSLGCKSGVCGATLCSREGSDCTTGADCCSGLCDSDKKCTLDTKAGCRATGEDCNSGGGASCCGTCVNNRCDLGPGACRPLDAPCDVAADCCTGACTQGAGNVKRCTGACIDTGGACQTTADCCSGTSCTGSPSTCTSPTSVCKLQGDTCAADGECCSLQCLLGRCGDNCPVLK